ncbi:unnamed protein product [Sphenostylis stenocarpa]|uniref:Membrane-bound O-acyltransferase C24H6.01c n=1 Tax=Sphenostylis stenocarpa TaxID=92480 RepID=A0AA86W2U0_9FABA|nr:unnamed protein product [Sphenostylis stenocarpa]
MATSVDASKNGNWKRKELWFLVIYAIVFYVIIINRSLQLSSDYYRQLSGLRPGWLLAHHLNDVSDAQWRNFRGNLPVLTLVFGIFTLLAYLMRAFFNLRVRGMSIVWLVFSLTYLSYLHGAWQQWAFLDNYRGSFRWHICFNFVALRMISFAFDYHWTNRDSHFDQELAISMSNAHFVMELSIISVVIFVNPENLAIKFYRFVTASYFDGLSFITDLDLPQNTNSVRNVTLNGFRWILSFLLMELMTHLFYYNAFANSDLWKHLSPMDVFIIGYGVLNFMWLKFLLIWRFFRLWSLINGIEAPENMPKCINNCHNLEGFWKNWHASFNKWLVRYIYIPLGGSKKKLLNVWVIFTFVAIWHDLEWKLLSWAWLTCLFFIPELVFKSAAKAFQAQSSFGACIFRELSAVAGAVTITCLMVANLVGFVVGPSGINWLLSSFLHKEGLPVLGGMLMTFYVGTKIMFHIDEAKQQSVLGVSNPLQNHVLDLAISSGDFLFIERFPDEFVHQVESRVF